MTHADYMAEALAEARLAAKDGEVPVGCVIVQDGDIIARGRNAVESALDVSAHAEIIALRAAAQAGADWRLPEATLYVTLEPCVMCMGALHLARLRQIYYAADDPRFGACGSYTNLDYLAVMGPPPMIRSGLLADQSLALLQDFFKNLRGKP